MAKMAPALILIARKLRPYFLSHPVTVLTNSPLGWVMTHPDASGRLVKWAVELGEYDVEYKPRAAIKAQALSDFLTEVITFGQEEMWRIFIDGASSLEGSGVGVILISPTQEKTKVAVRLPPSKSNNESEYEAVITCLKFAQEEGAGHVIVYSDSQLVVQQVQGTFSIRERRLQEYAGLVRRQGGEFSSWSIEKIPREHNFEADTLAKMAASLTRILPEEEVQARKLKRQGPLLRCLSKEDVGYVLQEVHEGCCGDHGGALSLARRTLLAGYWWPTLQPDRQSCRRYGRLALLISGFYTSCPMGPGQKNFLLVAVDYFSKWVEAEPLAKITEGAVLGFIWKNIVYRFGLPQKLISDNGRQF
ncbi:uncharacterized protein [Henckelia pumila]|uniref:uncharacterized protein n=1 Tax=Henckelia pumila TaxID=405737 RepID=UPI003C6E79A1